MATVTFSNVTAWTIPNGTVTKVVSSAASTSDKVIWAKPVWKDATYWNPSASSNYSERLSTFLTLAGCTTTNWIYSTSSSYSNYIRAVDVDFYDISNQTKVDGYNYAQIYSLMSTNKNVAEDQVRIGEDGDNWKYMSSLWNSSGTQVIDHSETASGTVTADRDLNLHLAKSSAGRTYVQQTLDDEYEHGTYYSGMYNIVTDLSNNGVKIGGKLRIGKIQFSIELLSGTTNSITLIPITDGTHYAYRLSTDSITAINYGAATKYFSTGG